MEKQTSVTFVRSIQVTIGGALLALMTLVFSGFGVYQYRVQQANALVNLNMLADTTIARLKQSLIKPLWEFDMTQLEQVILSEMGHQAVWAIVVKNENGTMLKGKTRDADNRIIDVQADVTGDLIVRTTEMRQGEKNFGTVTLSLTPRLMKMELRRAAGTLVLTLLVLDGVLLCALTLGLRSLLIQPVNRLLRNANAIAAGDFGQDIAIARKDEIGALANAFRGMQTKVAEVVRDVKTSAAEVAQRSREMNAVAEQMSSGASQQASATEEVSASMEEMAANIRQTAENARLTEGMSVTSAADARAGKQAVTEIIQAMEIIAERISVVQEIASQTNMLSLNATIEAAKAQEYGKGFTVVASSVRDLARQSRTAADEIRTLVNSCVALSVKAGEVLHRLVPNSEKTAELVQEINAATQEQSRGVEQVNHAVQQLDMVTQHNAATAEEVSSTAESLTTQAEGLQHTMAFFTVNEVQPPAPTKEEDLLQRLQELERQLADLRGAAFASSPSAMRTLSANHTIPGRPATPDAASHPHGIELKIGRNDGEKNERDNEFERY